MSQQDDQNRSKQPQGGDSRDARARQGQAPSPRPDQTADVEDTDDMDDDRDEDWRPEGGANRRFNIG
jgi:hypothetical protein